MGVVDAVRDVIQAFLTGIPVGLVFALAKLPPPAPAVWAGVAGIAGIVFGWMFLTRGWWFA